MLVHSKIQFYCLVVLGFHLLLSGCGKKSSSDDPLSSATGGTSIDDADDIQFISDISWAKDYFSNLDQASIPWVWSTFAFTETVAGVSGIPILFNADSPPTLKVDLTIQAAGSAQLGNRKPVTVFSATDFEISLIKLSATVNVNGKSADYEKIPDSVPLVGGDTIYPWYFVVPITKYNWSSAAKSDETSFTDAIKAGDLKSITSAANSSSSTLPVPWLDCETVKISVNYKGTATDAGKYQIQAVKYLAADPQVTLNLIKQLASAADPIVAAETGFSLSAVTSALESVSFPKCSDPTDADKKLFD